jgi:hypothetical protein
MIALGVVLLSLNNYLSYTDNCYQLYPSVNVNGTYVYPSAYYSCENARQAFSTPLSDFGLLLTITGLVAVIGGMAVDLMTAYKEETRPQTS